MTIRERYAVLLEACGIGTEVPPFDYSVFADPVPEAWVEKPFIAFCADSSDPRRCWEKEKFAALGNWLWKRYRKRLLFVGSDRNRAEEIIGALDPEVEAADHCGETTLFQLFTLVGKAEFLVSGDTGTAHAAAACGTLCFAVCGRGEYGTFVPYPPEIEGKRFFSIFSEEPCRRCYWRDPDCGKLPVYKCIGSISADQVKQVIEAHVPPPAERETSRTAG
jgi:ADP-heptose:LPS heptosyltransferase